MDPFNQTERYGLAGLLACMAGGGLLLNLFSAFTIHRLPRFRNAFGALTMVKALFDSGVGLTYVLWVVPTGCVGIPDSWQNVNLRFGQFSLFCQTGAYQSMLFISLNRYMAIFHPTEYRTYFTTKNAYYMIGLNIIISFAYFIVFFFDGCTFYFIPEYFEWLFGEEPCSDFVNVYIDFAYSFVIFGIVLVLDVVTYLKMRSIRRDLLLNTRRDSKTREDMSRRGKREATLVIQTCVSTFLYCFGLINCHVVILFVTSKFPAFFATAFTYGLAHSAEGLVLMIFYKDLRTKLGQLVGLGQNPDDRRIVTVTSTVVRQPNR